MTLRPDQADYIGVKTEARSSRIITGIEIFLVIPGRERQMCNRTSGNLAP